MKEMKKNNIKYDVNYPRIEINLKKLRINIDNIIATCKASNINVTGVIKGFNGLPPIAEVFRKAGCDFLASSRLEQIKTCLEYGIAGPYMMLRIPMMVEIPSVVKFTDCSLQSERKVIEALNLECCAQGKEHGVILMADMGDLREGFWDKEELIETAVHIENRMKHIYLLGIGTNLGCYGSIKATPENMKALVNIAERIEMKIGRKLDIVSGGASTSFCLAEKGLMPKRINNLRIGGAMLIPTNLKQNFDCKMEGCFEDVLKLKVQVIEVKDKPSFPVGERASDCFGNKCKYIDRGIRRRALVGLGKLDVCFPEKLIPENKGVEIIGGSSDHIILDIHESSRNINVGDVLEFNMTYVNMVFLTNSKSIDVIYV